MRIYQPKIEVRLIKVIDRTEVAPSLITAGRYEDFQPSTVIDLTPYLGDGGGVRVSKGVKQPAGGFTITFGDKVAKKADTGEVLDSLYAMIEPMDLVEIRMAHDPYEYSKEDEGYSLPVVMRGFVTDIGRNESMGGDGRPARRVVVSGQDYGKILQIFRIAYINNSVIGDNVLHQFKLLQKYGIDTTNGVSVEEFVDIIVNGLLVEGNEKVGGYLKDLLWWDKSTSFAWWKVATRVTARGRISSQFVNSFEGSLYDVLASACDVLAGFNELYFEDSNDATTLVVRPTPWHTAGGEPIQSRVEKKGIKGDGGDADVIHIGSSSDLISISTSRTDQGIANFVWVRNYRLPLVDNAKIRLLDQPAPIGGKDPDDPDWYQNCSPAIYGLRFMEVTSNLGPPDADAGHGAKEDGVKQFGARALDWLESQRLTLSTMAKDSVVFERGTMRLRGNERIKAGRFVRLTRSGIEADYYCTQVEHEFIQYQGFTTTVSFERGEGFIKRAQHQTSPYLDEIKFNGGSK